MYHLLHAAAGRHRCLGPGLRLRRQTNPKLQPRAVLRSLLPRSHAHHSHPNTRKCRHSIHLWTSFFRQRYTLLSIASEGPRIFDSQRVLFGVRVPSLRVSDGVPEKAVVHFTESKKEIVWEEGTRSILELAESAGLKPEFGCRFGSCGACEVRLRKDKECQEGDEKSDNMVRICSAVPTSSVIELEF
ncbi:hypothetical protein BU26DRAFT_110712 [Trematosphaeria pertusa]|uniref:2Fe-2S ferredoxin-type domain-containing protein n=1 Tax=Trematosphaeria pertusa TaxID=390896 RepID=A0A6A6I1R2_9PLEO|nr:uncharacterized protein BU26DRAFT_110712 [Trematosphaeria pertusa]KAF2243912.1 hypothetical protein BU26DRAFT_110712 [Trematosphaeria pertusa]